MTHLIEFPWERYREALSYGWTIIKDDYGIQHGDTLKVVCAKGWNGHEDHCRTFFAYASRMIHDEGLKDGYVLILLDHIGPHELRPCFNFQEMHKAFKKAKHGNA